MPKLIIELTENQWSKLETILNWVASPKTPALKYKDLPEIISDYVPCWHEIDCHFTEEQLGELAAALPGPSWRDSELKELLGQFAMSPQDKERIAHRLAELIK